MLIGKFSCLAHPHHAGHILRAGTDAFLLLAAVDDGFDADLVPDIEKADALRSVDLMAAGREQVDAVPLRVQPELSVSLHRIDVEQDAAVIVFDELSERFEGLSGSDLIVDGHD